MQHNCCYPQHNWRYYLVVCYVKYDTPLFALWNHHAYSVRSESTNGVPVNLVLTNHVFVEFRGQIWWWHDVTGFLCQHQTRPQSSALCFEVGFGVGIKKLWFHVNTKSDLEAQQTNDWSKPTLVAPHWLTHFELSRHDNITMQFVGYHILPTILLL